MKPIRKAVALALALSAAGCGDFLSGPGLTENPNNPTVGAGLQQLIALQSNMATRLEGQLARCAGVFTQQLIGSNNQQLAYCTQYGVTEQDISGQMSGFYTGGGLVAMRNIQAVGNPMEVGMAKIWEGLAFGTAASVWGDLPYSEANNPAIIAPALDPQATIYAEVQLRLDEGIAALQTAPTTGNCEPSGGDLIYCAAAVPRATEIARWIAAANTLKARFYLHLVERNGTAAYALALAAAQNGIAEAPTSVTQAMHGQAPGDFRFWHGSVQDFDANIWGEFLLQRQDLVAGHSFIQILQGRGDPRIAAYFTPNSAGAYIGHNQNNVKVVTAPVADSAPAVINIATRRAFTFRQPIVTWAENQLILAEAKFMTGDSAGAVGHVDAVRAAVGMAPLGNVSFTDIMLEKHIAMYQNIDVWSDYKRTCIPALTPFATEPEVLGRMPYGSAERTTNPNVPLPSAYPALTTGSSAVRNWNDPNPC